MPGRSSPPMPARSLQCASRALTKVPLVLPAPGCTTIPAALLITIRSPSSYSTSSAIASASGCAGNGGGMSTSICSPPFSFSEVRTCLPSTSTLPVSTSLWTMARDSPSSSRLRKRSILVGSFSGENTSERCFIEKLINKQRRTEGGTPCRNNRYGGSLPDGRFDLSGPLDKDIHHGGSVDDFRVDSGGDTGEKMLPTLFELLLESIKYVVVLDAALDLFLVVH